MSAAIIGVVEVRTRAGWGPAFRAVSPVTLTPLSIVYGLLTAFLAGDVWPHFERAQGAVGVEAMALHEAVVVAEALPLHMRNALRDDVRHHIDSVVREEWPAMEKRRQNLQQPATLDRAFMDLLSENATQGTQQLAQRHVLEAVEVALDARRQRILLSQASVGSTKLSVLVVLACLVLGTIAIVHAGNRRAQAITVGTFAAATAAALIVILVYDRPFGGGGISIEPTALIEVRPE